MQHGLPGRPDKILDESGRARSTPSASFGTVAILFSTAARQSPFRE